ncbi:MAG: hypothetical protein AB8B82_11435 [Roseovarius sp.]
MRRIGVAATVLVLGACTTEGLVSTAYPDRQILRFNNSDQTEVFSYACEKGETDEATKTRAAKAHRYLDGALNKMANTFADQILAHVETGAEADIKAITTELETSAERAALQTEEQYQCLFVGGQDI